MSRKQNFWPIVGFEYRKLLRRRMVWAALGLMLAACIFSASSVLIGNSYVEGKVYDTHANILRRQIVDAKALSGRRLDDVLVTEMQEGFARVPDVPLSGISEEYQTYARPYEAVMQYVYRTVGDPEWKTVTAEELYETRKAEMEKSWENAHLSQGEKEFLRQADEKVEKPFVYEYCGGYQQILILMSRLCVLQILLIAICVPPIFSEEHSRKTDQMIQCSEQGKRPLYLAKLFVGTTFSLAASGLLFLAVAIPVFSIYGTDGANAVLQMRGAGFPWTLTIGEVILILLGIFFIAALMHAVLAMLLSEYFRSSTIALAILTGCLLCSIFFNVPGQYRILAQLWNAIPTNLLTVWGAFGNYLYPWFGTYLTAWQAAPVGYLVLTAGMGRIGFGVYRRFQAG